MNDLPRKRFAGLPRICLLLSIFLCVAPSQAAKTSETPEEELYTVEIARFSSGEFGEWEEKSFKGNTRYRMQNDEHKGSVLHAQSNGTASALGKRVKIDLTKTPYLNWTWKIDNQLEGIDEAARSGDDFVARIYVVKTAGILGRNSRAMNYVWSSNRRQGSNWSNPFSPKNSKMIAVRGVEHTPGQWFTERRNIAEDFLRFYGAKVKVVDLLVIMSDTDNTGLSASASYGDIFFSSQ